MSDQAIRLATALGDSYRIDREIGAGGMATVFLARDLRHNRNVALKVLNPELGAVLGVERFLAEIQVTANLQHPNLLPLFDSGEADGLLFYVMPYVEGESLRSRLEREKQLPVDEAVRIATTICSALDYAHRHKVIHRDLKPENILLHEAQPLIADFGIALAVSNAGGARITQTGLSLGTPQYMSPEQATGDRVVDGRTDIYSLGAVTYEMLVGDPPHVASTVQAVIAKVLTETPAPVRASRPSVPAHVDAAIGRALEKLAADRFATARDFADALEGKGAAIATPVARERVKAGGWAAGVRVWQAATIALAAVAGGALWLAVRERAVTRAAADAAPVVRANFDLPPGARVTDVPVGTTIAVSPGGDMIAFTSTSPSGFRTYVRRIDELAARELGGDYNLAGRNLAFSPDGRWVAFTEGSVLKKISVDGGQAVLVADMVGVPYGLSWSASDTIYIGTFNGLRAVSAGGGTARLVARADLSPALTGQRWPLLLPGERAIAYASGNTSEVSRLAVLELGSGRITQFDLPIGVPLALLTDQLVYVSASGVIMAVRFDAAERRPLAEPVPLDDGVVMDLTAGAKASLSPSGTLAYLRGRPDVQPILASGTATAPVPLLSERHVYSAPRFSPDGRRVAITVTGANAADIWIYDLSRNTFTRLTTEGANIRPEWTPDGKRVVYRSQRGDTVGIWWQPADGSGPAELLYEPEVEPYEAIVSPDMKWLVFRTAPSTTYPRDILAVPLTGDRTLVPVVTGPYAETMPRLSPDGKWLAYQSNEGGAFDVYVRPFPPPGARVQVSQGGGTEPIWGRSGRSLYYRGSLGEVIEVGVTTGTAFSIGQRKVVLTGEYLTDSSHPNYDVAPDGRFLMLKRAGAESQTVVVHNWGRELREKTAPRR